MATVIDDTDPNFGWFGDTWSTNHTADSATDRYFNGTFHSSTKDGEYAIVAWHGTDIVIYGARRNNHGIYGISVDNGAAQYYSGYSGEAEFQAVLYASSGLAEGDHKLKISNENGQNIVQYPQYVYLDIDDVEVTGYLLSAAALSPADADPSAQVSTSPASSTSSQTPQAASSAQPQGDSTAPPPASDSTASSSASIFATFSASSSSPPSPSSASAPLSSASAASSASSAVASASSPESSSASPNSSGHQSSGTSASDTFVPSFAALTSTTPVQTTGTPRVAGPLAGPSGANTAGQGGVDVAGAAATSAGSSHQSTIIAVSVSIIVVAVIVIATVLGLWTWRRKRRRAEQQRDDFTYTQPGRWTEL